MHEAAAIDHRELDRQVIALLPTRDTLCQFACINVNTVVGVNLAFAINAASSHVTANAVAGQYLAIFG